MAVVGPLTSIVLGVALAWLGADAFLYPARPLLTQPPSWRAEPARYNARLAGAS